MDETVRLQTLDGLWEVGGTVRARGIWPEGLTAVANKKGPDTARFILRREPGMPWPDLLPYTPVDIVRNGIVGWEGFVDDTPEEDDYSIAVQCLGWQHHLDHDTYRKAYVHAKLGEYVDTRSVLTTSLFPNHANGYAQAMAVSNDGGILFSAQNGTAVTGSTRLAGMMLDLGGDSAGWARRVLVEYEHSNNDTGDQLYVRASDFPNEVPLGAGQFDDIVAADDLSGGGTPAAVIANTTSPRRYIHLFIFRNGATGNLGADVWLRIKRLLVFSDTAYESGGASILKDDLIWKDALTRAPLIDGEQSGIQPQNFNFIEFAMTEERTPGEVADALDAVTNGVRKIQQPGRRPILKANPTVPLLRAGPWAGSSFKDSSKNSGREIYNRALVTGSGPAGEQMRVERTAGQQPGATLERISSPVPDNSSFDTDATSWTASGTSTITRDTLGFDTSPASGRWNTTVAPGSTLTETFTGTFRRGQEYALNLRLFCATPWEGDLEFGHLGSGDRGTTYGIGHPGGGSFVDIEVRWVPRADRTGVTARITDRAGNSAVYVDTLTLYTVAATILGRRRMVRAKVHSMSQAINDAVGEQIADTFLQTHQRAPLKGELAVTGRGGVRRYLGDAAVDPFELLLYTAELIHLADQIDPDLATIGRDGQIAAVTYTGDDESAAVSIDNQRDNFEATVERYQLVAGAGR